MLVHLFDGFYWPALPFGLPKSIASIAMYIRLGKTGSLGQLHTDTTFKHSFSLWMNKKFNIEDHDFQGISIKDNCAIKLSTHDNKY